MYIFPCLPIRQNPSLRAVSELTQYKAGEEFYSLAERETMILKNQLGMTVETSIGNCKTASGLVFGASGMVDQTAQMHV